MDIHRADPAYRTRTLLLLALTALACTVFLLLLHAWLQRVTVQLMSSDPDTMRRWLRGLFVSLGFLLARWPMALSPRHGADPDRAGGGGEHADRDPQRAKVKSRRRR